MPSLVRQIMMDSISMEAAIEQYSLNLITLNRSSETLKSYSRNLNAFNNFLDNKYNCLCYVHEIVADDIEDYLNHRRKMGVTASGRRHTLAILSSFFYYCQQKEWTTRNVAAGVGKIRVEQKERVYLTELEVEQIIAATEKPMMQAVFVTLYRTGLRISELINLALSDVDLPNGIILVRQGKGKKDRRIPISQLLDPVLRDYLNQVRVDTGTDYFFSTISGRISRPYVHSQLKAAAERAGINKQVSPHILRHSFASSLLKAQVNLVQIQQLLGHSSLNTTSIYCHTNLDELKAAVNQMD